MDNFKTMQIDEDIKEYQDRYSTINRIDEPDWAFNFWVLDKLFSIDDQVIETQIIDNKDKGMDCFVWNEDGHDLYIIQNKYYAEETKVSRDYLVNDFLTRPLAALEKGEYQNKCRELQDIYTNFKDEDDFYLHFYLYVTNNSSKTEAIVNEVEKYNNENNSQNREVKFFSLDDIEQAYYDYPIKGTKKFKYKIKTVNNGTVLNIDNKDYKTQMLADSKYIMTSVLTLYEMYNAAAEKGYSLFHANIRDYLGATGAVNKKMKATLNDPVERKNFFYYNNGITMIVEDMGKVETSKDEATIEVSNPQIVNGCQTVSTIVDALSSLPKRSLKEEFEHVYVMLKVLKIPTKAVNAEYDYEELRKNIVRYNNSQNAINEKAFEANTEVFNRVQAEFDFWGFLVCLRQSDKNTFKNKYKTPTELKNKNIDLLNRFSLEDLTSTNDFIVDLEKLLQVFLAFETYPADAIQNKSRLLKSGSTQNVAVERFIRTVSADSKICLYLFYLKADRMIKKEKLEINPFYMVYCFSHYDCQNDPKNILLLLDSTDDIDKLIEKYKKALIMYKSLWDEKDENKGKGYNSMIKSPVDMEILNATMKTASIAI